MSAADGAPASRLVSVWLGGLDGRTWWDRDADGQHLAASTMKLPLAVAAHRLHEQGRLDLDAAVPVHAEFGSVVPGERFALAEADDQDPATWAALGSALPLRVLLRRALVCSSNIGANLVWEQVGAEAVAAVLADVGSGPGTVLPRGIGDLPATGAGLRNLVTARDLGLVTAGLAAGRLCGETARVEVERDLRDQEHRDAIPAGLPAEVWVGNKSGWVSGVSHDVALVRPADRDPFVLVVLSRHGASQQDGAAAVARMAAEAWDRVVRGDVG